MPKVTALALIPLTFLAACGGGGGYSAGGGGTSTPTCTDSNATLAQQVANPATFFSADNNGVILELPAVGSAGATTVTGAVVFGIGTQSNNALGSATVLPEDVTNGFITATYKGAAYSKGYIDSGSNANFFNDSSLTTCPSPNQGFYCPSSTMTESVTLQGTSTTMVTPSFSVANADALFSNLNDTAFSNLGGTNPDAAAFNFGLPFFYGNNVYTAFENASAGGYVGPYFAYSASSQSIPTPGPPNVETVTVDGGPSGSAINTAYVSVKICVPGTMTCQTIDHIEVDTGSTGLRILYGALNSQLNGNALPQETNGTAGVVMTECLQFADGSSYGSLRLADITLPVSGETAANVVVQLIGDPNYAVPNGKVSGQSACPGAPENTVMAFGANGILGVGPFAQDCGNACVAAASPIPGTYYSCH